MDVYVVTAVNGRPPAAAVSADDGFFAGMSSSSVEFQVQMWGRSEAPGAPPKAVALGDIRGIALEGTMDEFCRTVERQLDRPVVNESQLEGAFAFHAQARRDGPNDFLDRLRDQLHIAIAPATRRVAIVTLKPR